MEHVEAVEASEQESEAMLGFGDAEGVGEGGEWVLSGRRKKSVEEGSGSWPVEGEATGR